MASSTESTIFKDKIQSRYSVPQSSSVAGVNSGTTALAASSALTSTSFSARRFLRSGRNWSAIFLWTIRDSQALHTPMRCVFALQIISNAILKSAVSSTKIWQFPVPVSITGTVLFSTTERISPAPPLGISTSTQRFKRISSFVVSLLVSSISCRASSGSPALVRPVRSHFAIALLDSMASLPPFKITAFPDLKQRPKASAVTLGRASQIMAMTPKGTLFWPIFNPFGRSFMEITSPTGSSKAATFKRPSAIDWIRPGFKARRSNMPLLMPELSAFS